MNMAFPLVRACGCTGRRVLLRSQLLKIDFRIQMPDSVKSLLKKSIGELKRQLEEAKSGLMKLEQQVSEQECSVRNVSDNSASSSILNREAEAKLEFIGHEYHYDVTNVQSYHLTFLVCLPLLNIFIITTLVLLPLVILH